MKYIFKKKRLVVAACLIDAIGRMFFMSRFARLKKISEPRSFLVTRMDHLGDVLLSLPVASELKARYPKARVVFVVSSATAALLKNNPSIDETVLYDAPWFKRGKRASPLSFFGLLRKIRGMRFDAGLSLRGDLRENLLFFLARIPIRIGYGITGGGFFLTHEIPYNTAIHESGRIAALLEPLGIQPQEWKPRLFFDKEEEAQFDQQWLGWGADPAKKHVGFQIEAVESSREWPASHVRHFCESFVGRFKDVQLVLIGSKPAMFLPKEVLDLSAKTSVRQFCLLLKKFDAFVGLISGPSHLAAASGVPTLCLYSGSTQVERWTPLGPSVRVFRAMVPCAPCALAQCPLKGHPCMTGIEPEAVLDALEKILHTERGER
jgi:heptosyltransferase-1